jgi:hypothetical protein
MHGMVHAAGLHAGHGWQPGSGHALVLCSGAVLWCTAMVTAQRRAAWCAASSTHLAAYLCCAGLLALWCARILALIRRASDGRCTGKGRLRSRPQPFRGAAGCATVASERLQRRQASTAVRGRWSYGWREVRLGAAWAWRGNGTQGVIAGASSQVLIAGEVKHARTSDLDLAPAPELLRFLAQAGDDGAAHQLALNSLYGSGEVAWPAAPCILPTCCSSASSCRHACSAAQTGHVRHGAALLTSQQSERVATRVDAGNIHSASQGVQCVCAALSSMRMTYSLLVMITQLLAAPGSSPAPPALRPPDVIPWHCRGCLP